MKPKALVKDLLGEMPFTAEMYWLLRHRDRKIHSRFNLEALKARLPEMVTQVGPHASSAKAGKKIFIFACLHFWINHAVVTGLALRGLGHDVTLGYLPLSDFDKPISHFDLRRQDLYARSVLQMAAPLLKTVPFLSLKPARKLPEELIQAVNQVTVVDTQYILQREEVTGNEPIFLMRQERNLDTARRALALFQKERPEIVIIPNGMIQEFGAVYETARYLDIFTVTYEFLEINQRILLAQNDLVMHHPVDELWSAYQDRILDHEQRAWLESFLAARQGNASTSHEKFAHLYQKISREGREKIRTQLKLDNRPVILLPANILGDTATLGHFRSLFSNSMAGWIIRAVEFFVDHPEAQLIIRIHPSEAKLKCPSVAETIRQAFPNLPEHIHLIGAQEKINTYDLIENTDLALVYTTTVGLEMATRGIPVLLSGNAHYRKKGFTLDADSWEEYFRKLEAALADLPSQRLTPEQIERAWNYTYFYFQNYPRPFPWHIEKFWANYDRRPLGYVLSPEGRAQFEASFQEMAGEPMK